MVMNCVNLHSMKQAKWLSSPRWMGHRSCKVRTRDCRTEGRKKTGGEEMERKERRARFLFSLVSLSSSLSWFSDRLGSRIVFFGLIRLFLGELQCVSTCSIGAVCLQAHA